MIFGFELENFKNLDLKNLKFENGWFNAERLSLEKYLAPFLFEEAEVKLTGVGDFKGTFQDSEIDVSYDMQNVIMENENFVMETQSIKAAEHFFNLKEFKTFGKIPVAQGSYFEKNSGLLFTDIQADFEVDDAKITAPFIEAFCNGVYFSGKQELDLTSPNKGEFTLSFHIPMMKGKFSQIQQIFSHFDKPNFFLKMPLESDVSLRQEGAFFNFNFKENDTEILATIKGDISNGTIQSDNFDVGIQELNVNFDMKHFPYH
jgi:hypothetical protein